jgi:hypothetical protein
MAFTARWARENDGAGVTNDGMVAIARDLGVGVGTVLKVTDKEERV